MKAAPIADFTIYKNIGVSSVSKIFHYRRPEIVKAKHGWYIKFYYRIPPELRHLHNNKVWQLYRIKEDINRRKGFEKEQYAEYLKNELDEILKQGFNPFTKTIEKFIKEQSFQEVNELNATDAMLLFLETWSKKGLDKESTMPKYNRIVNRWIGWLKLKRIPYINIKDITQAHVEMFLNDMKKEHDFGNREYNNHFTFTRTIFNFLLDKKHISESPCKGIVKLKSKTTKHRYYDEKTFDKLISLLQLRDPYTLFAAQVVYYLCIRSEKELKNFKVGNIFWKQNKILIDTAKGNTEGWIPMDEHIKEILLKNKIDQYPGEYFVFGIKGAPAIKPFGKGFFAKRFRKICDEAGLSKDATLYGMKHQRIIDLKQSGLDDATIMNLTRHKDFTSYAIYLRNLGMNADASKINAVSKRL